MPKTLEQLFGLSALTKRDEAAFGVLPLLTLPMPRTDCPTVLNIAAPLAFSAKRHVTVEEMARIDAEPLPQYGNLVGALQILRKTETELSARTPTEILAINSRFASIQTRGDARAYAASVMEKVGIAREQRKIGAGARR